MRLLFFFIDGIGLGENNPASNPFAKAKMPMLTGLLGGRHLVKNSAPYHNIRASLLAIDACLGVNGVPQSATGQAALLTGKNIPQAVGYHFGPWPNQIVVDRLEQDSLFSYFKTAGLRTALLNAYPPSYFQGILSGKHLYSAIPQAVISAGIPLKTVEDLYEGMAISADLTAMGWRERLNMPDTPILTPYEAGERLEYLSSLYEFSFFEYWLSDYAGHHQNMETACEILETLDLVLEGLLNNWDDQSGLILLTSDHGNMEDLSTRRHTTNPVPALLIGAPSIRREFINQLTDITDITPSILKMFNISFTKD